MLQFSKWLNFPLTDWLLCQADTHHVNHHKICEFDIGILENGLHMTLRECIRACRTDMMKFERIATNNITNRLKDIDSTLELEFTYVLI
jgi:Fe-S-cluster-containing dehydrogenase component